MITAIAMSLQFGAATIGFDDLLSLRLDILSTRAFRSLCAIAVGAALAVSGLLLQALTRNPLADRHYRHQCRRRPWISVVAVPSATKRFTCNADCGSTGSRSCRLPAVWAGWVGQRWNPVATALGRPGDPGPVHGTGSGACADRCAPANTVYPLAGWLGSFGQTTSGPGFGCYRGGAFGLFLGVATAGFVIFGG